MRSLGRPLAAVLILAVVGYHASLRRPTRPEEGGLGSGPVRAQATERRPTLRVGTFNIHGGKGRDGRRDLARTARALAGLDLVGLNEVHGSAFPQQTSQAQILGQRLAAAWLFAPAEDRWYAYRQFGNSLLTRLDVPHWQCIPLPRRFDRSCRNMLLAEVRHEGRPIRVLITHLTRRDDRERRAQLGAVGAQFLALPPPAILLGDLNTSAEDSQIRRLLATPGVLDPLGQILGPETPPRIDWILVRGLEVVDAGIEDEGASDHPLIWAELKWPNSEPDAE